MNILTGFYLSVILSVSLVSSAQAAKGNYNRIKASTSENHGVDDNCNGKTDFQACKPQQTVALRCTTSNPSNSIDSKTVQQNLAQAQTCSKPSMQQPSLQANSIIEESTTNTKAQDYNSSRSNRGVRLQNDNDIVLRKRPGRTKFSPSANCPTPKNSDVSPHCPDKND